MSPTPKQRYFRDVSKIHKFNIGGIVVFKLSDDAGLFLQYIALDNEDSYMVHQIMECDLNLELPLSLEQRRTPHFLQWSIDGPKETSYIFARVTKGKQ